MSDQPAWVNIQKKTFTKWANNHLRKSGYPALEDVATDFETGVNLANLVNALYKVKMRRLNPKPRIVAQKIDNLRNALDMLEKDAEVKTHFLKVQNLLDHDLKMILGMLWSIILDYAIKGIGDDNVSAKEGLLLWCRKKTKGYRAVDPPGINNFKNDWQNGMAFCALIHKHRPELIDYDSLDENNNADNLELAFSVAEEKLGIARLLDVEDMKDTPDAHSVMTYVSEYFHKFSSADLLEHHARRAAKFVNFLKTIRAQQNEYERRATALLEAIAACVDGFSSYTFSDSPGAADAAEQFLKTFIKNDYPSHLVEKIDLDALFAHIQTTLTVNDRKAYSPPAGLHPDDLAKSLDGLSAAQSAFGGRVRDNRFQHIKKPDHDLSDEKKKEMKQAYDTFDALVEETVGLGLEEFKAVLVAMGVPFAGDAAAQGLWESAKGDEANVSFEAYTKFVTDFFADTDTADEIKEAFKQLAGGANTINAGQLGSAPIDADVAQFLAEEMQDDGSGNLDYTSFVDANY